jgi:hypothetical protein
MTDFRVTLVVAEAWVDPAPPPVAVTTAAAEVWIDLTWVAPLVTTTRRRFFVAG